LFFRQPVGKRSNQCSRLFIGKCLFQIDMADAVFYKGLLFDLVNTFALLLLLLILS